MENLRKLFCQYDLNDIECDSILPPHLIVEDIEINLTKFYLYSNSKRQTTTNCISIIGLILFAIKLVYSMQFNIKRDKHVLAYLGDITYFLCGLRIYFLIAMSSGLFSISYIVYQF